jgi:hypothetical protein
MFAMAVLSGCDQLDDASVVNGRWPWVRTGAVPSVLVAAVCANGYRSATTPFRTCYANGTWSAVVSPCMRTLCCAALSTGDACSCESTTDEDTLWCGGACPSDVCKRTGPDMYHMCGWLVWTHLHAMC